MKDLAVTVVGAVTSLVTALLLVVVERTFEFSFHTWTFWLVVPAGALISGLAAASGYVLGARLLNRRPARTLLVSILGVSVATFFVIHYLTDLRQYGL